MEDVKKKEKKKTSEHVLSSSLDHGKKCVYKSLTLTNMDYPLEFVSTVNKTNMFEILDHNICQ